MLPPDLADGSKEKPAADEKVEPSDTFYRLFARRRAAATGPGQWATAEAAAELPAPLAI